MGPGAELEPSLKAKPTQGDDAPTMPWAQRQGAPAAEVEAMVLRALGAIRARPVSPSRCGTDAKEVLGLWRALGRPPCAELADELVLVAEWAQTSVDKAAARDIRAEGWADGTDRRHAVSTLCCRKRWGDRLDAARAWKAAQTRAVTPGRVVLEEQADGSFRSTIQPRPKLDLWAASKELGL